MTLGPEAWEALGLSLRVALVATLVNLPVGLGIAYALARGRFWGREALNILAHLPLVLPPVVTGYVLLVTFGPQAPLGGWLAERGIVLGFRWTGAALAAGVMAMPFMVRAIRLSLEAVDPRLEEAARTLGASELRIFATVTLPLVWPGILAGAVLSFAKGLGEFGATITFVSSIPGQTRTLPLLIDLALERPRGEGQVAALALLALAVAAAALVLSEWLSRRVAARVGA